MAEFKQKKNLECTHHCTAAAAEIRIRHSDVVERNPSLSRAYLSLVIIECNVHIMTIYFAEITQSYCCCVELSDYLLPNAMNAKEDARKKINNCN